jgi:hypothetical protein
VPGVGPEREGGRVEPTVGIDNEVEGWGEV